MNLPTKSRKWLKEVKLAYSKAENEIQREDGDILDVYLLAPKYMSKNRGITSKEILESMQQEMESEYKREILLEPEERLCYLFHFVHQYIRCHVYAGVVDEMECDRVMEYINDEWNLFPELPTDLLSWQ